MVWPAAHVLSKYLEIRFACGMEGKRVADIGSGTGFTGFIAARLGADVTLTDQECIQFLLERNLKFVADEQRVVDRANVACSIYDWGTPCEHLKPPFDFILASECVLPKLYPIEPLIQALAITRRRKMFHNFLP